MNLRSSRIFSYCFSCCKNWCSFVLYLSSFINGKRAFYLWKYTRLLQDQVPIQLMTLLFLSPLLQIPQPVDSVQNSTFFFFFLTKFNDFVKNTAKGKPEKYFIVSPYRKNSISLHYKKKLKIAALAKHS